MATPFFVPTVNINRNIKKHKKNLKNLNTVGGTLKNYTLTARKIASIRSFIGYNQKEFADLISKSWLTVQKLETAKTVPTMDVIVLLESLGVRPGYITGATSNMLADWCTDAAFIANCEKALQERSAA